MSVFDLENTPLAAIGTMLGGDLVIRDNERAALFKVGLRAGSKEVGFRELQDDEAPDAACVWYMVNGMWLHMASFVDEAVLVSRVMEAYELVLSTRKRVLMLPAVTRCLEKKVSPAPVEVDRDPVCGGDYDPAHLIRLTIAVTTERMSVGLAAPGPDDYYSLLCASGWLTLLSLRYDKSFAHHNVTHEVIEKLAPLMAVRKVSLDELDGIYRAQIQATV